MEAATDLAGKAAQPILELGVVGAVAILLAIALFVSWVYFFRRMDAKDAKIDGLQESRLSDTKAAMESVTAAVKTVESTISVLNSMGRK